MNDHSEPNLTQIDRLCDEFERAWQAGQTPRIEDNLSAVPPNQQSILLLELLKLEIHYRNQNGDAVARGDYASRFPGREQVLNELFELSTVSYSIAAMETTKIHHSEHEFTSDAMTGRTGTRYVDLRPHAKGGLGEVFLARDTELDRDVALKEIQERFVGDPNSRSRFVMEAEVTGKLEHPGIVPVYGLGTYADGRPFYAMKFIRGESLQEAISRFHQNLNSEELGPGNPFESIAFRKLLGRFVSVCQAVGFAHERGVLHRDLKPGNVMLGPHGETLVVDWGLAKLNGPDLESRSQPDTLKISSGSQIDQTIPGSIVGTPGFMSPEQADGCIEELGPSTDIYGLGATLFVLLTGRKPVPNGDIHEILQRTIRGDVLKPRAIQPVLPKPLDAICQKAMAFSPRDRYSSCEALADDVERFLADEAVTAHAESLFLRAARIARKHRGIVQTAAAALVLITLLALGSAFLINEERNAAVLAKINEEEQRTLADIKRIEAEDAKLKETQQKTIAESKRQEAEDLSKKLKVSLTETQRQLYFSQIYRAIGNMEAGRYAQAQDVLHLIPFEWRQWEAMYLTRQAEGTALTLRGHTRSVSSVAFSPDGRRIVTGDGDGKVKVWDVQSGAELLTLRVDSISVPSVAFSPDGRSIVSGGGYKAVKVWDAETGKEILTLRGLEGRVSSVRFSPDGLRIVSGGGNYSSGELKVWDAQSGAQILTLRGHEGEVHSVTFSPDSRRIVSGSGDKTVKVWDAQSGGQILTLRGHEGEVHSVAFSPDGRQIASGCSRGDNTVKVWDAQSGAQILTLRGHEGVVPCVVFSPDGRQVISGSDDTTVKVWDAQSGSQIVTFRGHKGGVQSVAFSPDGRRIVTGGDDTTVKVWDAQSGAQVPALRVNSIGVTSVAFEPHGRRIVCGGLDNAISVWDAASGAEILALQGPQGFRQDTRGVSVAFSADGRRIVSGGDERTVKVWDAESGAEILTLAGHEYYVSSVAFSPDGRRIVSGSGDHTVKIWDVESGAEILTFRGHKGEVTSVAFSQNSRRIVSGGGLDENTVKVWDAESGAEILTLRGHEGSIHSVAFSPDGQRIVTGSSDNTVKVWDAESGAQILSLLGHEHLVDSVEFSPDSRRIISGSWDKTVKVWDAESGAQILSLLGNEHLVSSVAFSPDSRYIVSGGGDGTVKIWDIESDQETLTLVGHVILDGCVAFSTDGRRIVSRSNDNTAKLWDSETGKEILTLRGHESVVCSITFSPDGQRIVTGSEDNTVKVWDAESGEQVFTLRGHNDKVSSVAFSTDGRRIVSGGWDIQFQGDTKVMKGMNIVWDAETGKRVESEELPKTLPITKLSPDGLLRVVHAGDNIQLIRKNSKSDLWAEDVARRKVTAPAYHVQQADAAEMNEDWFAAVFHLRHLLAIEDIDNREDVERRHQHAAQQLKRQAKSAPAIAEKLK